MEQKILSIQLSDGGSNPTLTHQIQPKELFFKEISNKVGDRFLVAFHYLHRRNTFGRIHYGAFYKRQLVGASEFSYPVLGVINMLKKADPEIKNGEVAWNSRTYMHDICGKNSESRFLGWCFRDLKTNWEKHYGSNLKAVVSYADTKYGHRGIIYQALGMTKWAERVSMTGKNKVYPNSKSLKISYVKWLI